MYNKRNCQSCVRQEHKLREGYKPITLIVTGQYAFKWSVTIVKVNSSKSLTFPNRLACLAEVSRLKKMYKQFNDVNF